MNRCRLDEVCHNPSVSFCIGKLRFSPLSKGRSHNFRYKNKPIPHLTKGRCPPVGGRRGYILSGKYKLLSPDFRLFTLSGVEAPSYPYLFFIIPIDFFIILRRIFSSISLSVFTYKQPLPTLCLPRPANSSSNSSKPAIK